MNTQIAFKISRIPVRNWISPLLWRHGFFFIAVSLACFAFSPTAFATRPPTPTPTPTPTATPLPNSNFLRIVYDWSAQKSTSYLGNATTFLGTTISGQTIGPSGGSLPNVPGTLYLTNNKPTVGSASIDVLVGAARQDGKWTGTVPVTCVADWSPQYAPGTTATLTVTLFDSTGTILQTQTKTIIPGVKAVPTTLVGTVTYSSAGTFTLN